MKISQKKIIEEIDSLIEQGSEVLKTEKQPPRGVIMGNYVDSSLHTGWRMKNVAFLKNFLTSDSCYIIQIESIKDNHPSDVRKTMEILKAIKEQIQKGFISIDNTDEGDKMLDLHKIFSRFHKIARQLKTRYNNRETLEITDEYDVQNLLQSLLVMFFDDIRPEEWTPSYAGSCARMDFLLKKEQIVIEVKKTRKSMTAKDLGEQLIVDIEKYRSHPDCKMLYCFVYDPEGYLGNPQGIISDLENAHSGFVKVNINPE